MWTDASSESLLLYLPTIFSGPGIQHGECVSGKLLLSEMSSDIDMHLVGRFMFTLSRSNLNVKTIGQSSRTDEETEFSYCWDGRPWLKSKRE